MDAYEKGNELAHPTPHVWAERWEMIDKVKESEGGANQARDVCCDGDAGLCLRPQCNRAGKPCGVRSGVGRRPVGCAGEVEMTRFLRSPYFPLAVQAVIAAATVTQLVLAMNGVVS